MGAKKTESKGRQRKKAKRVKKAFIAKKVKVVPTTKAKEELAEVPTPVAPRARPLRRPHALRKIPTGIAGVDKILAGGIERGSAFLVYGTPHCGKKPFLMQTAHSAAKRGIPVIFILTDHGVAKWKEMMAGSGWKIDRFAHLFYFIDCYSKQYGPVEEAPHIRYLEIPYTLTAISIECTKSCEEIARAGWPKPLVIFHSISTLIESFGEAAVFDFLQFFIGKLREEGITCALSLQYGMHDERTITMILALMDGIAEMKGQNIRLIGYKDIKSREWFPYTITKRGIKILKAKK